MKMLENPILRGLLLVLSVVMVIVLAIVSIAKSDPANDTPNEIQEKITETLNTWSFQAAQYVPNQADPNADSSVVGFIFVQDDYVVVYESSFEILNLHAFPGVWGKITTPEVRLKSGEILICEKDEQLTKSMIVVFACRLPE